jgi:hypothetical protein
MHLGRNAREIFLNTRRSSRDINCLTFGILSIAEESFLTKLTGNFTNPLNIMHSFTSYYHEILRHVYILLRGNVPSLFLNFRHYLILRRIYFYTSVSGNFSLHHCVQTGSEAHPASYSLGNRGAFPGDKAAGTRS